MQYRAVNFSTSYTIKSYLKNQQILRYTLHLLQDVSQSDSDQRREQQLERRYGATERQQRRDQLHRIDRLICGKQPGHGNCAFINSMLFHP